MIKKRILILAPHTDDGELGCGGSIAKFCMEGEDVFYAAFSLCTRSLPAGLPPDTLAKEVRNATEVLGIKKDNLITYDFDVRRFKEFRQDILEELVKIGKDLKPDLIYVPSPTDIHQDHEVIYEEGVRAFKNSSIFGYEMPWNNFSFHTRCFIKLNEKHIDTKVKALAKYESQKHRAYVSEEFIKSLAITRGIQVGSRYAEAFDVIRLIM